MQCDICQRKDLTEQELRVHIKYFHKKADTVFSASNVCPDCGATMWLEEGCSACHSCGFSKCA